MRIFIKPQALQFIAKQKIAIMCQCPDESENIGLYNVYNNMGKRSEKPKKIG